MIKQAVEMNINETTLPVNILLTVLNVYLLYKAVQEDKKTRKQTKILTEKQLRLSVLPYLYCRVKKTKERLKLTIHNIGTVPAYDIDVLVLGLYHVDDMGIEKFCSEFIKSDYKGYNLRPDKEGFYCVYDRLCYPVFPHSRKATSSLGFPGIPQTVYIFLQWRDVSGINYSQVYWLFEEFISSNEDRHPIDYKIGSLEPKSVRSFPRVELDVGLDWEGPKKEGMETVLTKLVSESGVIPNHVEELVGMWEHSIPCGYTKTTFYGVEDRGTWSGISC